MITPQEDSRLQLLMIAAIATEGKGLNPDELIGYAGELDRWVKGEPPCNIRELNKNDT